MDGEPYSTGLPSASSIPIAPIMFTSHRSSNGNASDIVDETVAEVHRFGLGDVSHLAGHRETREQALPLPVANQISGLNQGAARLHQPTNQCASVDHVTRDLKVKHRESYYTAIANGSLNSDMISSWGMQKSHHSALHHRSASSSVHVVAGNHDDRMSDIMCNAGQICDAALQAHSNLEAVLENSRTSNQTKTSKDVHVQTQSTPVYMAVNGCDYSSSDSSELAVNTVAPARMLEVNHTTDKSEVRTSSRDFDEPDIMKTSITTWAEQSGKIQYIDDTEETSHEDVSSLSSDLDTRSATRRSRSVGQLSFLTAATPAPGISADFTVATLVPHEKQKRLFLKPEPTEPKPKLRHHRKSRSFDSGVGNGVETDVTTTVVCTNTTYSSGVIQRDSLKCAVKDVASTRRKVQDDLASLRKVQDVLQQVSFLSFANYSIYNRCSCVAFVLSQRVQQFSVCVTHFIFLL